MRSEHLEIRYNINLTVAINGNNYPDLMSGFAAYPPALYSAGAGRC